MTCKTRTAQIVEDAEQMGADRAAELRSLPPVDLRRLALSLRRGLPGSPAMRDTSEPRTWLYALAMRVAEERGVWIPSRGI